MTTAPEDPLADTLHTLEGSPGLRTYAQAIIDKFSLSQQVADLTPYLQAVTLEVVCVVLNAAYDRIVGDAEQNPLEILSSPLRLQELAKHFESLAELAAARVGVRVEPEEWPDTVEGE